MPDPELQAMEAVQRALQDLDEAARARVIGWVAAKYEIAGTEAFDATPRRAGVRRGGAAREVGEYEEVGELVHATAAATGAQRALAVAYWLQEIQGHPGWTGGEINATLKNLGHGLANVTVTLSSLMKRRPALVMQTAKGKGRQAHKTYKLTQAGVREVGDMLGRASAGESDAVR